MEPVAEPERTSNHVSALAVSTSETAELACLTVVVVGSALLAVVVRPFLTGRVCDGGLAGAERFIGGDAAATPCVWCQRWATTNPRAAIVRRPSANMPFSTRVSGTRPG